MNSPSHLRYTVQTFDVLAGLIRSLPTRPGHTAVIGIDGCAGSGKTTFARQLAKKLGTASIIHTDDFASWDNPLDWWPRMLQQVLEPLFQNNPACYQRYDWDDCRLAEWHTVSSGIVLIEGVSSTREEFQPYLAYGVWVECSRDVRLARGLKRDGEQALPFWENWMIQEDTYTAVQQPKERADLVVDGNPIISHDPEHEYVCIAKEPPPACNVKGT